MKRQKGNAIIILVILTTLAASIVVPSLIILNKPSSSSLNINNQTSKPLQKANPSANKQQSVPTELETQRYKADNDENIEKSKSISFTIIN